MRRKLTSEVVEEEDVSFEEAKKMIEVYLKKFFQNNEKIY